MATFTVRHEETSVGYFDVEAESIDKALRAFEAKCNNGDVDFVNMDVIRSNDMVLHSIEKDAINQIDSSASIASSALARQVLAYVNHYGFDYESFATTIASDHKTLQQSVMRLFIETIREMAMVTPDARNEQTVELAKKIVEIADGYSLPLI